MAVKDAAKRSVNEKQARLDAERAEEARLREVEKEARRVEQERLAAAQQQEAVRLEAARLRDAKRADAEETQRRLALEERMIMWKYVGEGTLLGVPARDLTDEEYAEYSVNFLEREGVPLASTGFYVQEGKAVSTRGKPIETSGMQPPASEGE